MEDKYQQFLQQWWLFPCKTILLYWHIETKRTNNHWSTNREKTSNKFLYQGSNAHCLLFHFPFLFSSKTLPKIRFLRLNYFLRKNHPRKDKNECQIKLEMIVHTLSREFLGQSSSKFLSKCLGKKTNFNPSRFASKWKDIDPFLLYKSFAYAFLPFFVVHWIAHLYVWKETWATTNSSVDVLTVPMLMWGRHWHIDRSFWYTLILAAFD